MYHCFCSLNLLFYSDSDQRRRFLNATGSLRSTTATATKMALENVTFHNLKSFEVISSCSRRTMWANYPKIEFIPAVSG